MPTYKVSIKCDLENVKMLTPIPNNLWTFNIASVGGADRRDGITVSEGDAMELEGSKGSAHFVMKWNKGEQQSYIKVVPLKKVTGTYNESDNGKWVPILGLECRGIDVVDYVPGIDFDVETTGGTKFQSIDLTEKEWSEYDEENDLSLSIMNFETKIEKA